MLNTDGINETEINAIFKEAYITTKRKDVEKAIAEFEEHWQKYLPLFKAFYRM